MKVRSATLIAVLASAAGGAAWWWTQWRVDAGEMLARLPQEPAVSVVLDVETLRQSGVWDAFTGSSGEEEPDYRAFAEAIQFDYRQDVDLLAMAWNGGTLHVLAAGRFSWSAIENYAKAQGGSCGESVCRFTFRENRQLTLRSIQPKLVGVSVGPEAWTFARQADAVPVSDPAKVVIRPALLPNAPLAAQLFPGVQSVTLRAAGDGAGVRFQLVADAVSAEKAEGVKRIWDQLRNGDKRLEGITMAVQGTRVEAGVRMETAALLSWLRAKG